MTKNKSVLTLINKPNLAAITAFYILFYLVGIAGMLIPYSHEYFNRLTPLALILSFIGLVLFDKTEHSKKTVSLLLSIFILSFIIESIGVNTGVIFGNYQYGNNLGPKIFNTPIIIGFNWVFLVYSTAIIVNKLKLHPVYKVLIASISMLIYDLTMEQMAPELGMWYWQDELIPLQNYLAWFALALIFHSVVRILKINFSNKIALLILSCQFLFFLILYVSFKIIN